MAGCITPQGVVQNLKDAGCSPKTIERFAALGEAGEGGEQLALLLRHRQELLRRLHREERRIDCLDYLVYQMQKDLAAL